MTGTINAEDAMKAISSAITARGREFVYQNKFRVVDACEYVVAGEPACIVGYGLIEGLDLTWPRDRWDNKPINGAFVSVQDAVEKVNDVKFTDGAVLVLTAAQSVQDSCGTWGLAEDVARSIFYALPEAGVN